MSKPQPSQSNSGFFKSLPEGVRSAAPWLLGIILAVGLIWMNVAKQSVPPSKKAQPTMAFSMATMAIANQFICPCGSCGEERLSDCDCGTAIETKREIEGYVRNGVSEKNIKNIIGTKADPYTG